MSFFKAGALVELATVTATSGTPITLTVSSKVFQQLTGSTAQTINLPDETTLSAGRKFVISNRSTATATVLDSAGNLVGYVVPNSDRAFQSMSLAAATGNWDVQTAVQGIDQPLRMYASVPGTAALNFSPSNLLAPDGTEIVMPVVGGLRPVTVASTANFQTGATTGATFTGFTLPTVTVGQFVRCGFTQLSTGGIQAIFSAAAGTLSGTADPGTLFAGSGNPIGYIDLVATGTNAFKTVGSSTSIIEANPGGTPAIHRFGNGGGGGGGSLIASGTISSPQSIVAGTGIAFSGTNPNNIQYVQGSGGPVTISATNPIALGSSANQVLYVVGASDASPVTINDATTCRVGGTVTFYKGTTRQFIYDLSSTTWFMVGAY